LGEHALLWQVGNVGGGGAEVAKKQHTGTFIFGAIVGGFAAAGYTLWKTPQSGARLRTMMAEQAEGMLDRVTSLGEKIGVETGPSHEYPSSPTTDRMTTAQAQITTIEPGEGPIADDMVLPGVENIGDAAATSS
jgi:gas vesicle protein